MIATTMTIGMMILRLPLDSEFFAERFLDDVTFVGKSLDRIRSRLQENARLIRRAEYLYQLVKVEGSYAELLEELRTHEPWAEVMAPHTAHLSRIKAEHHQETSEVRLLLRAAGQDFDKEEVITADELALLIQPDQAEESSSSH